MKSPYEDDHNVIRIDRHEALGAHADDLLNRQKSLRGDPNQFRSRKSRWWYRSWFVLMLAGGIGSFAAWALLEPYLDDYIYFQGQIEFIHGIPRESQVVARTAVGYASIGRQIPEGEYPPLPELVIRGEHFWLPYGTMMRDNGGEWRPVDFKSLSVGQEVGVFADSYPVGGELFLLGWYIVLDPPPQSESERALTLRQLTGRSIAVGLILFGVVAGFIGLAVGAVDGAMCRLPRRALLAGGVGLLVGFIGGFVAGILADVIYAPLSSAASQQMGDDGSMTTFGFTIQMLGRGMAWALAGTAMGLGQGIVLRSKKLLLYGFLGGLIGGLLGGLVFDPIDMVLLDSAGPSAHWSRMVGILIVGLSVGAMIGVVELLARDAWLRMTEGPLSGKEFLIFKDLMRIGASPRSDIFLFNDDEVAERHANLRMVGDDAEIESVLRQNPVRVNARPVDRARLRHGDQITIGRTSFVFEKRRP